MGAIENGMTFSARTVDIPPCVNRPRLLVGWQSNSDRTAVPPRAPSLKRLTLELSGKRPNIIRPDADLERAIPGSFQGIYSNCGQACNAGSRLFVQRELFDEVIERLAGYAREAKVGPGLDPETEFGPLVSEDQFERVRG